MFCCGAFAEGSSACSIHFFPRTNPTALFITENPFGSELLSPEVSLGLVSSQQVLAEVASCARAGILGCAVSPVGSWLPGAPVPWPWLCCTRQEERSWPLEIRMFLWLNCFVASIECVPGLALNSCTGLEGSSSSAQAAGTGIMLILLGSQSVPRRQLCCPAATSPARVAPG